MRSVLFQLCSSLPTLIFFSLALLALSPGGQTLPHHPVAYLPTVDNPDWEAALLQLQASLGIPGNGAAVGLNPWALMQELGPQDLMEGLSRVWGQEGIRRDQREELGRRPLGPFPDNSLEAVHYQEGGEDVSEGGEKINEALNSIAGGLQAFNRQKGGFGFRFGRK